ncbi:MAG: hypothetical protein SGJ11_01290 [Phycisphaerae bacterium]|nr:hypothetical protein [Phycisphaerae bacterium]
MTTPKAFLLGCVAAAFVAGSPLSTCYGQQTLDSAILAVQTKLSAEQQAVLKKFLDEWLNSIESPGTRPRDLVDARQALILPLQGRTTSLVFRQAYAELALKRLSAMAAGTDTQRAIIAMQIARYIGTSDALAIIVERLSPAREPDVGKRMSAATTLGLALPDAVSNTKMTGAQIDAITREVERAALSETDTLVLLQEVRALTSAVTAATVNASNISAATADRARIAQVKVLQKLIKQIGIDNSADARVSVNQALLTLRDQWLALRGLADRQRLGPVIAPALADAFDLAGKQWDAAHADPAMTKNYSDIIVLAEALLRNVDSVVRPSGPAVGPERAVASAWDANDRKTFDAQVAKWMSVLATYSRP